VAIHSSGSAWIIFTWDTTSKKMKPFIESLLSNYPGREADAIIKYFFTISENIAIRPGWWRSLEPGSKAALQHRIMDGSPLHITANVISPKKGEPVSLRLPLLSCRFI
jgi:hypothetical protein